MNDAIIAKLQKILARAEAGRGASQAEMETAMAMAQKLAAEHNLDIGAIMAQSVETGKAPSLDTDASYFGYRGKSAKPEHVYILWVLQACFGVQAIRMGRTSVCLVGEKTDVAMAQFCFKFLESQFSKLMRQFIASRGRTGYGTAVEQASFYTGLYQGIVAANKRAVEEQVGAKRDAYALVLVNKSAIVKAKVAQLFPDVKITSEKARPMDWAAQAAGKARGAQIKLNQQIA